MDKTDKQEKNQENIFHERVAILREEGYRGFGIKETQRKWGGIRVIANNNKGMVLSASGETGEEAYAKLIDKIDWMLVEPI